MPFYKEMGPLLKLFEFKVPRKINLRRANNLGYCVNRDLVIHTGLVIWIPHSFIKSRSHLEILDVTRMT